MAKKALKIAEAVNREEWKTSLELMDEFGYQDRGSISAILTANKIPWVKNPESHLPHSKLYSRSEFIATPTIINRLMNNEEMESFREELHIFGDCMIFADAHIPLHDPELFDFLMAIAKKFGIRKGVVPGDLVELDAFKTFFDKGVPWQYEKRKTNEMLRALFTWFTEINWLIGNHEARMWKRLQGAGDEEDVFKVMLDKDTHQKMKYSTYPYAIINESWMVVHPKSYSRIQARNAYFLASKYLPELVEKGKSPNGKYGIIAFHGHMGGFGQDISGRFEVADGMCMLDPDKVHYYKIKVDTAPNWRPGFFMLLDNTLYPFPKNSVDKSFWLDKITYERT